MAAFEYIALNNRGKKEKGTLEADSSRQARQLLRDKGMAPLSVVVTREEKLSGNVITFLFKPSLSIRELALITRQLATLIAAALPVEEALLAVSKQSENPRTTSMLLTVRSKVMEGYSLANSLAEYPRAFPQLYRATVAAGESAGHLDLVLNRLADFTESQQDSKSRIQQAMVYPTILFVLTVAILAGLLGYVVPDIVKVFADTGQELPALTRFIIASSEFVKDFGLIVLVAVIVIIMLIQRALTVKSVRLGYDRRLLHLPLIAKMSRGTNTAQFASTLSILSSSGVPLVDAMRIAGQVLSNTWLQAKVDEATEKVSEGASLNAALEQSNYFPPMMLHMIASGEASGELDDMLSRVATSMQQDVELLLGVLLSLFGPLMLLLMGGAVFTIVMAILLPIINLNQLVG
ncbi:MAG TPA: type II secretion system inner membrane protein GspF [Pseudomonadales bacterium]|jgi:general secretion pathway protein F|nr:type II secretion system protein GspF [Gammaproteobacteria bacterium]MDP6024699.1 type II secretion system inner membrane protein GspF [Pseudomonadales bacterium]MDP6315538.1 type II secretion system inner membrane protein GspF [Pseudomonadales bacterium]MDP7313700.1 type II secretion system inner membrane protein GspF [Pseudomonadales bacterium]HJL62238.1 type II secretion system inner membrane protein GspF [Pseudomonadales bacterium]|tara:strand:- start:1468 stop:2685 length:1218 start_codon:yes stop_codon:yes gene_type:complete